MAKKRVIKKKKVAKKKTTKKRIVTPKDAPLIVEPITEVILPVPAPGLVTAVPIVAAPIPEPEEPKIEPVPCAKCGHLTSEIVFCPKCPALMCITCAGHSPCPRCGV